MYPDYYVDPLGQAKPIGQTDTWETEYMFKVAKNISDPPIREDAYLVLKKDGFDFYTYFRDWYEGMRKQKIKE